MQEIDYFAPKVDYLPDTGRFHLMTQALIKTLEKAKLQRTRNEQSRIVLQQQMEQAKKALKQGQAIYS